MIKHIRIFSCTGFKIALFLVIILIVNSQPTFAKDHDQFSLSIPASSLALKPNEMIASFEINIVNGEVSSFPRVPNGWGVCITNDPDGKARIEGNIIVGSAALKPEFLIDLILIKKKYTELSLSVNAKIGILTFITLEERLIQLNYDKIILRNIE